nr:hypothetical protein Iba_chr01aCG1990 [Ipomoea batatas]
MIAERFLNPFLVDTKALCDWVLQGQRENHRLEQTHPLPEIVAKALPEIVAKKKVISTPSSTRSRRQQTFLPSLQISRRCYRPRRLLSLSAPQPSPPPHLRPLPYRSHAVIP